MLNCTAGEKTVNIYCQLLSEKSLCFYTDVLKTMNLAANASKQPHFSLNKDVF